MLKASGILLLVAWPVASQFFVIAGRPDLAAAFLALVLLVGLRLVLRSWALWTASAAAVIATIVLLPAKAVIVAPSVGVPLGLAGVFGRTLRPGIEPLISRFARLERGQVLDERLSTYTRRLTVVWTVFLIALAAATLVLALAAPLSIWSWFANVASYLLIATLFLGEWVYRRLRLAEYRHAPPLELLRTVRRAGMRSDAAARR